MGVPPENNGRLPYYYYYCSPHIIFEIHMKQTLALLVVLALIGTIFFIYLHLWLFYRLKKNVLPEKIDFFDIFRLSHNNRNAKLAKIALFLSWICGAIFIATYSILGFN
jgi:hypothetical protein